MTRYALDIETTTDWSSIRMVGIYGPSMRMVVTVPEFLVDCLPPEGSVVVTWNGSRFDFPRIKQLWGIDLLEVFKERRIQHIDAYLITKMFYPDAPSHSLDYWAKELVGVGKLEVDYDNSDLELLAEYCERDCELTLRVYEYLRQRCSDLSAGSFKIPLALEQQVARLIAEQGQRGFPFDTDRAKEVVEVARSRMVELEEKADQWLPEVPLKKLKNPPKVQFKKDGTLSAHMLRYLEEHGAELIGPREIMHKERVYSLPLSEPLLVTRKLTLSNQIDLKEYLLEYGWEPTIWNMKKTENGYEATSPRLTDSVTKDPCPNLARVLSPEKSEVITEWLTLRSRVNLILSDKGTGWLPLAEEKGRLSHDADTIGTPTGRFIHKVIVNVPRVTSPMGKELRSLFVPSPGMVMVGWDASSLEARMEAHYVHRFDPEYAKTLIEGDVHTRNLELLGLPSRDVAKTFKYAITYGARPGKLSQSLGVSLNAATGWYENFWDVNWGLKELIKWIEMEWEQHNKRYIRGLDGRLLQTRAKHALLNTKLQGAGAIVMKYAMVLAEKKIKAAFGDKADALIRYHDEEQWECVPEIAEEVGKMGVQSMIDAGEYLELRVPMAGEYKIGKSWAETH